VIADGGADRVEAFGRVEGGVGAHGVSSICSVCWFIAA
jgi:hypothetical protein